MLCFLFFFSIYNKIFPKSCISQIRMKTHIFFDLRRRIHTMNICIPNNVNSLSQTATETFVLHSIFSRPCSLFYAVHIISCSDCDYRLDVDFKCRSFPNVFSAVIDKAPVRDRIEQLSAFRFCLLISVPVSLFVSGCFNKHFGVCKG